MLHLSPTEVSNHTHILLSYLFLALSIHRIKRGDQGPQSREVQLLNMELQQIMKGNFKTFMQKEIFEQTESVVNTTRGRVLNDGRVVLGGIKVDSIILCILKNNHFFSGLCCRYQTLSTSHHDCMRYII